MCCTLTDLITEQETQRALMQSENSEAPWIFTYLVGQGLMPFIDAKGMFKLFCV